ncbi:MAG: type III pantothenate kinase [Spirochaetia bacterium]|jgi:type III pantothenate kinase|nr:type III pantothenate kinase [Spirochaetia bacterium]
MILGLDIGNTNTTAGIYGDDDVAPNATFRYITDKLATPESLFGAINGFVKTESDRMSDTVKGVAFSSVVPKLSGVVEELARSRFGVSALGVSHDRRLSLKIMYTDPSKLGADRIANAEAARREHPCDCIITDIGTAATICVLLADGTFEGGLIAPGIGVTIKALAQSACNLPEIMFEKPPVLVAKNTADALKAGFFYGWISMLEGVISRIEKSYGRSFRVIFTGGFAGVLSPHMERSIVTDPMLTMKGIKYIYDSNR